MNKGFYLQKLINDFLTVSRLKSGKFKIERSLTDPKDILKSEAENLTNQFKAKDLELKLNIDEDVPKMQRCTRICVTAS